MIASLTLLLALYASAPVHGQDPTLGLGLGLDVLKLLNVGLDVVVDLLGSGGDSGSSSKPDVGVGLGAKVADVLDVGLGVGLDLGGDAGGGGGGGDGGMCGDDSSQCYDVDTIDRSLNDLYCEQPFFVSFLTKTDSNCLVDNVCYTVFPLPDDPYTYNLYRSTVFCDGSSRVETAIATDLEIGRARIADPYCTYSTNTIGYAGCDTYVLYRCMEFGDCSEEDGVNIIGLSGSCVPMGLSCIQKVQEIVEQAGLPETEFFILPQKLPNRCVTEQICVNNIKGNFYRALNLPLPQHAAVIV